MGVWSNYNCFVDQMLQGCLITCLFVDQMSHVLLITCEMFILSFNIWSNNIPQLIKRKHLTFDETCTHDLIKKHLPFDQTTIYLMVLGPNIKLVVDLMLNVFWSNIKFFVDQMKNVLSIKCHVLSTSTWSKHILHLTKQMIIRSTKHLTFDQQNI